jgi:uncharacterized protein YecE (DUF72 family)
VNYIGTSGWAYKHWRRGPFYPQGLRQRDELAFIAQHFNSVELNGSFYRLQRPESYRAWYDQTPAGFVFAIKGSRFITHNKKLKNVETALANFFASGVWELKEKLGPIVWQLSERLRFDAERFDHFFAQLPREQRYALEPRSPDFVTDESLDVLRSHDIALVAADSGRWPLFEEDTASFIYLRLHGSPITYASQYTDEALDRWAAKIRAATRVGRDAYAYFDNDGHAHAPHDALRLAERLTATTPSRSSAAAC